MKTWLLGPFVLLWRYRAILARTTWTSLRQNHAGSALGVAWLVLGPFVLIALYAVVYALIFRVRPPGMTQTGYVIHVVSGLLPFLGFAAALNAGTSALTANRQLLLNTVFPAELIPLRTVLMSFVATAIGMLLVIGGAMLHGGVALSWLLLPLVLGLQIMFVAGLVWMLSLLNLVIRDVQQLLPPLTLALLIVTPIAYTQDMVPAQLMAIIYVNPLSYFTMAYQEILVHGRIPTPPMFAVMSALGVVFFCGAHALFVRVKSVMLDYA